jgi:hypothetical protein
MFFPPNKMVENLGGKCAAPWILTQKTHERKLVGYVILGLPSTNADSAYAGVCLATQSSFLKLVGDWEHLG